LISALNILSEAELNYKQARNKRLHVELTLIKLCYLHQALELVNDGNGLHKKKVIEKARSVAFRNISPIELKEKPGSNKDAASTPAEKISTLKVNSPDNIQKSALNEDPGFSPSGDGGRDGGGGAKLIIQPPLTATKAVADNTRVNTTVKAGVLEKIRREVASRQQANDNTPRELKEEEIYISWGQYIEKLQKKNNPSAVTNFKSAILRIADPNCIEIVTESKIHQSFIENERAALIEHLQQHFNNRKLSYKVVIESTGEVKQVVEHLSTKQQYLKMIEQYPLVKELKDKLKLELDY
jgi:DNA polymerase-3 subunit gamma/tau